MGCVMRANFIRGKRHQGKIKRATFAVFKDMHYLCIRLAEPGKTESKSSRPTASPAIATWHNHALDASRNHKTTTHDKKNDHTAS